jgi:diguanylate cyclase (GGDEF)-like protein
MVELNSELDRGITAVGTLPFEGEPTMQVDVIGLQSMRQRRSSQWRATESTNIRTISVSHDSFDALALAEKRLSRARRENHDLRQSNDRLTRALTAALQRETAAHHIAHHDGLTGLPNRLSLMKRLQLGIAAAVRQQHQLALLFIDLDGFKAVNDRFGHSAGDKLLQVVAARITACVRGDDIASRFGGDEFVVLLSNVNDAVTTAGIATKIREHIGRRYSIDGEEINVTASIGIALYPHDGEHCTALLSRADASMYRSKSARLSSVNNINSDVLVGEEQSRAYVRRRTDGR